MADAMVTGRMSAQKQLAGTRVLEGLGLTTSQAINQLFDYLINNGAMPCSEKKQRHLSKSDIIEAKLFVDSMWRPNSFSDMPYADMKRRKAAAMGYTILDAE